jgi:hypothetical protein
MELKLLEWFVYLMTLGDPKQAVYWNELVAQEEERSVVKEEVFVTTTFPEIFVWLAKAPGYLLAGVGSQ